MGKPQIRTFVVGDLSTNCYALIDGDACLVVDPGASGARIAAELSDVKVEGIVATHGHHDHVGGVAELKAKTGAPYMIGAGDAERATRALELSSHVFDTTSGEIGNAPVADRLLNDGDTVRVGGITLTVVDAPGHTEGGIVLLGDGFAFVGDTIFAGSVGRTDLTGGDHDTLMNTLRRLTKVIPAQTTLLCGHGPITTMAQELATNPWFVGLA